MARALAILRSIWFFLIITLLTIPMCTLWLVLSPFIILLGDRRRHTGHWASGVWARWIVGLQPWWRVRTSGRENLAPPGDSVVYVANHQHESDILMLFYLRTRFRWLSKRSVFYVPFIGWSMWLTGYVGVVRGSHESHIAAKKHSLDHLAHATPMLFFPEGTFGDGKTLQFKQGAFRLAQQAGADIIPITVEGTEHLFRGKLIYPGSVEITVHPRIQNGGRSALELAEDVRAVMAPALGLETDAEAAAS